MSRLVLAIFLICFCYQASAYCWDCRPANFPFDSLPRNAIGLNAMRLCCCVFALLRCDHPVVVLFLFVLSEIDEVRMWWYLYARFNSSIHSSMYVCMLYGYSARVIWVGLECFGFPLICIGLVDDDDFHLYCGWFCWLDCFLLNLNAWLAFSPPL